MEMKLADIVTLPWLLIGGGLEKQCTASLRIAGGYATQSLGSPAKSRNNDVETLIANG